MIPSFTRDAILRAYARGDKIAAIAAKYKVSTAYVNKFAREAGLPPRVSDAHRAANAAAHRKRRPA